MHTAKSKRLGTVAAAAVMATSGVQAIEIDSGNPDWSLRFDNTAKASLVYRTEKADPALADSFRFGSPQALNFNAGDDNFRNRGLVSKRVDLLSEFDAVYQKNFGLRLSGAASYGWLLGAGCRWRCLAYLNKGYL